MNHWNRGGGGVHCRVCGVEFANVFARNAHAASHSKQEVVATDDSHALRVECTVCGASLADVKERGRHISAHGKDQD